MAGSSRQIVRDYTGDSVSRAGFPRLHTHTSFIPPIRSITGPLDSYLGGVTAEVLRPQSRRVPKANWAFFISPTGSICTSLVSKAVTTEFVPNRGVTAKIVRQCVHGYFERSHGRGRTRSICPTSSIEDNFLTHNFPPNGRYSPCLPFLFSLWAVLRQTSTITMAKYNSNFVDLDSDIVISN
jgi:hypothetical protein